MTGRHTIVGAVGIGTAVLVVGLFALSTYLSVREPGWRENGARLGAGGQLAVDVALWWDAYGWVVVLAVGQVLLAAGIALGVRRAIARYGKSAEARDYSEGPAGPVGEGRGKPSAPPDQRRHDG